MPEQDLKLTAGVQGFAESAQRIEALSAQIDKLRASIVQMQDAQRNAPSDPLFAESGAAARRQAAEAEAAATRELSEAEAQRFAEMSRAGAILDEYLAGQDAQRESTRKNIAADSDYVSVLRQVNPALGQIAETFINVSRIAGDLASQNIDASKTYDTLKTAILGNVGALKLFGAGALVAVGIYAIAAAVRRMREEFEAATKAIRDQTEEATTLAQKQAELQQSIENLSDTRREGGFTADEARAAANQARRLRERLPFLSEDAASQAATFGAGRSTEEVERIAVAIQSGRLQLDGGLRPETRERRIEAALERFAEEIARTIARERNQAAEETTAARGQLGRVGGSDEELRRVASRFTEGTGLDPALIATIAKVVGEVQKGAIEIYGSNLFPSEERQARNRLKDQGIEIDRPLTQQEVDVARQVREYLVGPAAERQAEAAKEMSAAAEAMRNAVENMRPGATTNYYDQRGGRIVNPSSHARQRSNGETAIEGAR
ncbi:MAG: hypothetical protein J5J06_05620 [Phycisphaerae bacterium]|nr:hypothetical protein [Phycisphaerae bacterium]